MPNLMKVQGLRFKKQIYLTKVLIESQSFKKLILLIASF